MTQAITSSALDVVMEYHRAWTSANIDMAMSKLSDDFTCQTPGGLLDKQAFREYLMGFVPKLTSVEDFAQFVEADQVVLLYYPQTAITSTTLAAEHFIVGNGRIVESRIAFDRLSYAPPKEH